MSEKIPIPQPEKKIEDMTIEELEKVILHLTSEIKDLQEKYNSALHPLGKKALETSISHAISKRTPYDMRFKLLRSKE